MRATERKRHHLKPAYVPPKPRPRPTLRDLAITASNLFNYEGDKSAYLAFLNRHPQIKDVIIKEMHAYWREK